MTKDSYLNNTDQNRLNYLKEYRRNLREQGLCISCRRVSLENVRCFECHEKTSEYQRNYAKKRTEFRKENGLCRSCGKIKIEDKTICENCKKYQAENKKKKFRERRKNNLCVLCKAPSTKYYCDNCAYKQGIIIRYKKRAIIL